MRQFGTGIVPRPELSAKVSSPRDAGEHRSALWGNFQWGTLTGGQHGGKGEGMEVALYRQAPGSPPLGRANLARQKEAGLKLTEGVEPQRQGQPRATLMPWILGGKNEPTELLPPDGWTRPYDAPRLSMSSQGAHAE